MSAPVDYVLSDKTMNEMYKNRAIAMIQVQEVIALGNSIKLANHKSTWVEISRVDPKSVLSIDIYVTADGQAYLTAMFDDGSMLVPEDDTSYPPSDLLRYLRKAKLLKH